MNQKKRIQIALALIVNFIVIALLLVTGVLNTFNTYIYQQIATLIQPWLTSVMSFITGLGDFKIIVFAIIGTLITSFQFGLKEAITVLVSHLLNQGLKLLFAIPRPNILPLVEARGFGFPSGHAMVAATIYFFCLFFGLRVAKNSKYNIALWCLTVLVVFLIGFSRVYLGVHTVSDVLAGWSLGISIAILSDVFFENLANKRQAKEN